MFAVKGRNSSESFFKVRWKKVNDGLVWLKQNNSITTLYEEIIIDRSSLNELPVDGDVSVSVRFIDDSQSMDCDREPAEENEEEVKTGTFMPEKISQPFEETRLEQSLEWSLEVQAKYIGISSVSFNEFSTHCSGALAFSSLFPYG